MPGCPGGSVDVVDHARPGHGAGLGGVGAAVLAAGMYAQGARSQHRAVRWTLGGERPTLPPGAVHRLLRNRGWLAGLALTTLATGLHVGAWSLAPLTVVQPVGARWPWS